MRAHESRVRPGANDTMRGIRGRLTRPIAGPRGIGQLPHFEYAAAEGLEAGEQPVHVGAAEQGV